MLNGCCEPYFTDIKDYCSKSELNITLLQKDEGGVSEARNTGIDSASGKYIAFIDDDDLISPEYLSGLLKAIQGNDVALSNMMKFEENISNCDESYVMTKAYNRLIELESPSFFQTRKLLNSPCGKLFRRGVIGEIRFSRGIKNGEDALFVFQTSRNMHSIALTDPSSIYYYRARSQSATTKRHSAGYLTKNAFKLTKAYSKTFFSYLGKYDTKFYLSRIAAVWIFVVLRLKNQR